MPGRGLRCRDSVDIGVESKPQAAPWSRAMTPGTGAGKSSHTCSLSLFLGPQTLVNFLFGTLLPCLPAVLMFCSRQWLTLLFQRRKLGFPGPGRVHSELFSSNPTALGSKRKFYLMVVRWGWEHSSLLRFKVGSLVVSNWEHVIISVQAGTFTNKCHLTNWAAGCQEVPLKVNQMVSSWLEWI